METFKEIGWARQLFRIWGGGGGVQGGCERRTVVFVKIKKKKIGGEGRGGGVSDQGLGWGRG